MTAGNAKEACDVIYPRSIHELDTQEPRSYVLMRGYSFRSHYDRETLMRTKGFLLILVAGLGVTLICPELSLLRGQTPTSVGLTGQVSSKEEGPMEGVVVSAKRAGSTITVSVVTDQQGRYRFPRERMEPGQYSLKMRAAVTTSMMWDRWKSRRIKPPRRTSSFTRRKTSARSSRTRNGFSACPAPRSRRVFS